MTRRPAAAGLMLAFAVAGLLFAASTSRGQDSPRGTAADREQIMAIIASWEKAWNSHDMRAFGTLFHDDGVWVLWTRLVWKGRPAIEEGHAAVHKTVFRNSTQREQVEEPDRTPAQR